MTIEEKLKNTRVELVNCIKDSFNSFKKYYDKQEFLFAVNPIFSAILLIDWTLNDNSNSPFLKYSGEHDITELFREEFKDISDYYLI